MKQATQLPIPFEDIDPIVRQEPSEVPGAADIHFLHFDATELRALNALSGAVARAAAKAKALVPSIMLLAQAAGLVAFGFGIVFLAAIIGG